MVIFFLTFWKHLYYFDIIINATSLGLKKEDDMNLDFSSVGKNKFFYDVIYNPKETNFLKMGKKLGHKTENGKLMFIYQAYLAFNIWHKVKPEINDKKDILVYVQSKKSSILKRLKKRKNFNQILFNRFKKIQLPLDYKKKKSQFVIKNDFTKRTIKK